MNSNISFPYNFEPRKYQAEVWKAMENGYRYFYLLWARRHGKDLNCFNIMVTEAVKTKGVYYYFFPTYSQGRKALWEAPNITDHLPDAIVVDKNTNDMRWTLFNGSTIRIIGTDRYDSVRGTNPTGNVFSEYAFQNPKAWEVILPILRENNGWAIFNTTPNGNNHAKSLWEIIQNNDSWFKSVVTIESAGVLNLSVLDEDRAIGKTEEFIQQEYYCSFSTGMIGAYYGDKIEQAYKEERICTLPILNKPVHFSFDIGINDMTSIWVFQEDGVMLNMLMMYENNNKGREFYSNWIRVFLDEKGLMLGKIILPHDSKKNDFNSSTTAYQYFANEFGVSHIAYIPRGKISNGIEMVREMFPYVRFDVDNCEHGITCLQNYKKEYDVNRKVYLDFPNHDWTSHAADSFRYLATAWKNNVVASRRHNVNTGGGAKEYLLKIKNS